MKILALQLKRIGDLILTTPALFALRQNLPDAHITLAVESGSRELLPALDFVDASMVFNRDGCNGPLWRQLIFRGFDVCLDFSGTDRAALLAVLSKSPKRIAFESLHRSPLKAMCFNNFVRSSVRENHTCDHYLELLRPLGIMAHDVPVTLRLPAWAPKKARQILDECGVGERFALVHPGTARPEKYWVPERWAEVIDFLERELHLPCVLTGSSDVAEQQHLAKTKSALRFAKAHDLSGRLDLLTLAALTQSAALVLTVDSAPMHMAGAFGTPQVALFGKTNPFHWRPQHPLAQIIVAGEEALNPPFTPKQKPGVMSEISTQHVLNAILAATSELKHGR